MEDGSFMFYGQSALPSIAPPMDNLPRLGTPSKFQVSSTLKMDVSFDEATTYRFKPKSVLLVDTENIGSQPASATQKLRTHKLVEAYEAMSLLEQGDKAIRKFMRLNKSEKRAWRDRLQSKIAALKTRLTTRVQIGTKIRGKTMYRWQRLSALEESLIEDLDRTFDESTEVSFQASTNPTESIELQTGLFLGALSAVGMATVVHSVANVAENVATTSDNINGLVSQTTTTVARVDHMLSSFTDNVTTFINKLREYGDIIWKPCLIALAVWILSKYAHVPVLISVIVSIIAAYLPNINEMIQSYLPNAFRLQAGDASVIADVITMIITVWVPGKDVKSISGEFMKRVTNFPRASEGLETFIKKVLGLVEQLLNWVMKREGEQAFSFSGKMDAYQQWRNTVIDKMILLAKKPQLPIEEIRKIKEVQLTGLGFHQVLMTNESKRDLCYWLEKLNLALSPHEGAINAENNMRPMPACVMIGGGSGVGKTTLLRYIASCILLLAGECTVKDALENLWQKGSTEYWNGYIGQKCLVMDDCFQVKPKPGDMDSEAMQMIRGIGNWSYPLNMADLLNKGKFYLESCLIVGTTNCRNVHAEWAPFITEPKALTRRFQNAVWVTLNDEYTNEQGMFDFDRINGLFAEAIVRVVEESKKRKEEGREYTTQEVLDELPWGVWDLHPHTFDRESISDAVYPGGLRSMIENVAQQIKTRKAVNRKEIQDITSLLSVLEDCVTVETQTRLEPDFRVQDDQEMSAMQRLRAWQMSGLQVAVPQNDEEYHTPRFADFEGTIPPGFRNDDQAADFYSDIIETEFSNREVDSELRRRSRQYYQMLVLPAEQRHEAMWTKLKETLHEWYKFALNKLDAWGIKTEIFQIFQRVAFVLVLTAVMKIATGLVSALCSVFGFLASQFGLKPSASKTEEKKENQYIRMATFNSGDEVSVQVGVPPQEAVCEHIYNNTMKCVVKDMDVGQFIGIGSDVYIFPKHFLVMLREMNGELDMEFITAKDSRKVAMTISDFLQLKMIEMPGFDIAGVSFGRVFTKSVRNIVKYFLTERDIKNVLRGSNTAVRLDVAHRRKDGSLKQTTMFSPTCAYQGKASDTKTKQTLDGLVKYNAPTMAGDCGAPLSIAEARYTSSRCIMGFHSAGRDNHHGREGYSTLVSQEVARQIFTELNTYEDWAEESRDVAWTSGQKHIELQSSLSEMGLVKGSFELLGVLETPVNMPTKTNLKESTMATDKLFGECPMAPAVLRATIVDGEKREPMVQGLKAYQTPQTYKNPKDLRPIVDLAMQRHWEATKHHPRDLLSFEEAIKAPEGWKLKPINRKTSPGYSWSKYVTPRTPGKTAFFGHDGDYEFDYENNEALQTLKSSVDLLNLQARYNIRCLHLCTDFLKDELRPMKKVKEVATRVISATPVDYTIAVRQYFGAFVAAMFDTHVDNGMAPGVNQYTGWFKLVSNLKQVGDDVFDGDFSRFDASEQPWVHEAILDYVNRWYRYNNPEWSQEDENARNTYWLELVHSRHICGTGNSLRYVVQWNKSLPSGHPLTTMVNSMYSLITLTGCYMANTGDMEDMWKHAFINTFGDDNISAVDEEMRDKFNQVTVAQTMSDMFGLTYTPGNKSGVLVPYTDLESCTFLKRGFKQDDTIGNRLLKTGPNLGWVGPLAEESFLYAGYWYKNARDPMGDMKERLKNLLCELCLHTEDKWNEIFPKLEQWCHDNGVPLPLTSREATRNHVATRLDVWF